MSAGADTKANAWAAAAHPRLSIFVCGRISTSLSRPDMSLPWLVRLLPPKLQARGAVGTVRHQECQGALTQKQTLMCRFEVEAHSSLEIFVSLRMAASLEAPSAPM